MNRCGMNPLLPEMPLLEKHGDVTLILDAHGRIQFCSDPESLQMHESELDGTPVNSLIPGLKLRPQTPGYNVAYVRFALGNRWQPLPITLGRGKTAVMDVLAKAVPLGRSYCLVVLLRRGEVARSGVVDTPRIRNLSLIRSELPRPIRFASPVSLGSAEQRRQSVALEA